MRDLTAYIDSTTKDFPIDALYRGLSGIEALVTMLAALDQTNNQVDAEGVADILSVLHRDMKTALALVEHGYVRKEPVGTTAA